MADAGEGGVSKYCRLVLKISGEGFTHPGERGIAMDAVVHLAEQTVRASKSGAVFSCAFRY